MGDTTPSGVVSPYHPPARGLIRLQPADEHVFHRRHSQSIFRIQCAGLRSISAGSSPREELLSFYYSRFVNKTNLFVTFTENNLRQSVLLAD
jgi:hypothetical protein